MNTDLLKELEKIVIDLEVERSEDLAQEALANGIDPLECSKALTRGITEVGQRFEREEYFLPELVAASSTMKKALNIINQEIIAKGEKIPSIGSVVIGTVAGDIHSIGKDMVATLLFASGFAVIDLGVDVSAERFIHAVRENGANILAMSALLSTTVAEQRKVIEKLKQEGLQDEVKVMVGGAPVNPEFADSIGADGYGATAAEGVTLAKRLLGINS
jgi:corrinoid protein of di/trimethylamine methyltransferase